MRLLFLNCHAYWSTGHLDDKQCIPQTNAHEFPQLHAESMLP